jgi:hypothetical protein
MNSWETSKPFMGWNCFTSNTKKNSSPGYALCGVFLRHILARRNASRCFMVGPKRRIQPERYVQFSKMIIDQLF